MEGSGEAQEPAAAEAAPLPTKLPQQDEEPIIPKHDPPVALEDDPFSLVRAPIFELEPDFFSTAGNTAVHTGNNTPGTREGAADGPGTTCPPAGR